MTSIMSDIITELPLHQSLVSSSNNLIIYEVNLTIVKDKFEQHKDWLIPHFHDMVRVNGFNRARIFTEININPLDDSHLQHVKIVAQYELYDIALLKAYLVRQAVSMRNQVFEMLKGYYSIQRRVLLLNHSLEP